MADQILQIPPAAAWITGFSPEVLTDSDSAIGDIHPPGLAKGKKAVVNTRNVVTAGAKVTIDGVEQELTDSSNPGHIEFIADNDVIGEVFFIIGPTAGQPYLWADVQFLTGGAQGLTTPTVEMSQHAQAITHASNGLTTTYTKNNEMSSWEMASGFSGGPTTSGTLTADMDWWLRNTAISFFFRPTGAPSGKRSIVFGKNSGSSKWRITYDSSTDELGFEVVHAGGTDIYTATFTIVTGVYAHFGFQYDLLNNKLFLLYGGKQEAWTLTNVPNASTDQLVACNSAYGAYTDMLYIDATIFGLDPDYIVPTTMPPAVWSLQTPPPVADANTNGFAVGTPYDGLLGGGYGTDAASNCETWHFNGSVFSADAVLYADGVRKMGGAGTPTAALCAGGEQTQTTSPYPSGEFTMHTQYNGTAWAADGDLNLKRKYHGCCGSQGDALVCGSESALANDSTEIWGGTAWANDATLPYATWCKAGGSTGAAIAAMNSLGATYDGSAWTAISPLGAAHNLGTGFGSPEAFMLAGAASTDQRFQAEVWDTVSWVSVANLLVNFRDGPADGAADRAGYLVSNDSMHIYQSATSLAQNTYPTED